jgi:hypothetical protein
MSRCAVFRSERMYMYGYRVFWYQDASGQRHCRGFRAKRDFASDVTVLNSTSIVSVVYPPCVQVQILIIIRDNGYCRSVKVSLDKVAKTSSAATRP